MKKMKQLFFTKIIYGLFLIATIITMFIVYMNIDNTLAFHFLIGYAFFAFFMLIYVSIITIVNIRKFKWAYIRRSIFKFIALFILLSAITYTFNYIMRPSKIDLLRIFSNSLGLSFGIAFFDIVFFKEKI